jgi:hypothetical protein
MPEFSLSQLPTTLAIKTSRRAFVGKCDHVNDEIYSQPAGLVADWPAT